MALLISQNILATRYFVKANASGSNNGTSWANAFTSLQSALAVATSVDEVWVAAGTYKPHASSQSVAFVIPSGLKVYGGFAGNEATLAARNMALINTTNQTTLSGDLSSNDVGFSNQTDNSYRVVTFLNAVSTTTLDGFRILGGNNTLGNTTAGFGGGIYNNGSGSGNSSNPTIANCTITYCSAFLGGGMYNDGLSGGNASPTITNCIFISNQADDSGAGLANYGTSGNSSPTINRCSFIGNSATFNSGAINNHGESGICNPIITNCVFIGNYAANNGGAMVNTGTNGGTSTPNITNCSFSGNRVGNVGGVIRNNTANPVLKNSIIWGNSSLFDNNGGSVTATYSIVEGAYAGTGNLNVNPLFTIQPAFASAPTTTGDLHLPANSPGVNAGTNTGAPTTDLDGNSRPFSGTITDMGAYELQAVGGCSQVASSTATMTWTGSVSTDWTNPCNWTPNGVPTATNPTVIPNVTNDPIISSGTNAVTRNMNINLGGLLTVNSGANLSINNIPTNISGIYLDGGTCTNNGTIGLQSTNSTTTGIGQINGSVFTNGGTLTINVTNEGISALAGTSSTTFTNNVGGVVSNLNGKCFRTIGAMTITNRGTITNTSANNNVTLDINNISSVENYGSIIENSGVGVSSGGIINNYVCGKIILVSPYLNGGTTQNSGLIQTAFGLTNTGTFTNSGILKYSTLTGTIANSGNGAVIVNNTPTPIFTYGGTFNGTVNGIFTDATATTLAGTFTAPNTFSPSGLPAGSQTLYAKITPSGGACFYVVPFTYVALNPPTGVSASPTTVCNGSSVSLSATCSSGTITWYNQATGGSSLGTGNGFSQSPSINTTFYATCKSGANESSRVATSQVTVTTQPSAASGVSVNPTAICSGASTSLSATCVTGTINWYTSTTGAAIGTGSPFSQSPTNTTTYYVTCKNGSCETSRTSAGTVTVTAQPSVATGILVNPTAICAGASTSLSATCATGTVNWYTSTTGAVIGTGSPFSQSPTISTTYYVSCKNGSCETSRTIAGTVTVTTQPTAPSAVALSSTAVCSGTPITLSATCATGVVNWYTSLTGGAALGTGSPLSQNPSGNTSYFVSCKNGSCETSRSSAGSVTVTTQPTTPSAITISSNTICSGVSISLSATCTTGTVNWYTALTGGGTLGTGSPFNQSPSSNTTYYVSCKNGSCETARSTAGTVTVTTQPTAPSAVGLSSNTICSGTSISLSATCASGTVNWYTTLTGGATLGTGSPLSQSPSSNTSYFVSCKNGTCETSRSTVGSVTITTQPTAPSAIAISSNAVCSNVSISLSATCATGTVNWFTSTTGAVIGTGSPFTQNPSVNTTYYVSCKNGSCETTRSSAGTVTVTTQPVNPTSVSVNNTAICSSNSVSLSATCSVGSVRWYNVATGGASLGTTSPFSQSPTVNTTYYASCRNGTCESNRVGTQQVVVTNIPTIPTSVSVNNTAICNGSPVILSATCATGTITWYNQNTGGTSLGTGTGLSQSPSATTTYYASCENTCGASSRVATNQVVVTIIPNAPSGVSVNNTAICSGTSISLSATCASGSLKWYNQATGGTVLGTTSPFSQSPAVNTTYYAVCDNACGASARTATSQVVVTTTPSPPTGVSVDITSLSLGNDINLSATCASGTVTWYNQASGGASIGTGSPFNYFPPSAGNFTYRASCEIGACKSNRIAAPAVNVNGSVANPTGVAVNATDICEDTNISLSATCGLGDITWYNQATGGVSIGTGSPLQQTPSVGEITYYASCVDGVNESGRVPTAEVTVIATPLNPTAVSASQTAICNGTSISLSATCNAGTITWYNQSEGGASIGTGNGLSVTPTSTITYYAACENNCNNSSRVATAEIVVTNIPNIPTGVNVNLTSISLGNSISLTATCLTGTLTWYNQATGGVSIGTGSPLSYIPPFAGNFTYYASCESGACKSNRVATSVINVISSVPNPTGVVVNDAEICLNTSISLSASCSQGVITWYNQATGGSTIGTGSPFSNMPSTSTTYYASCKDGVNESGRIATNMVVVLTIPNTPTGVSVSQTAICGGTSISLSGTCATGTLTWYIQNTGGANIGINNNLSQTPFLTTTYFASCENECGASSRTTTGQVVVTPIPADPTSVAVSATNISLGSSINLSATCITGTLNWYDQATGGASIGTGNPLNYTPAGAGNFIYYASCESGQCKSNRVATPQVNINGTIANPTEVSASDLAFCVGTSINLIATCTAGVVNWYNQATGGSAIGTGSPLSQTPSAGTVTYYATCKDASLESARVATNLITITAFPTNPVAVSVSNTNICNGVNISLSATCTAGVITWYNLMTGGAVLGTGNGLVQSPSANTTYYVACENGECASGSVATNQVNVTQNVNDPTNISVSNGNICSGTSISLSATCTSGVINWYASETAITALGTGIGFSQTPSINSTYFVSCKDGVCESDRIATGQVQVTQNVTNPTAVSVSNTNICNGVSISLSATCTTGIINWYDSNTAPAELGTGNSFMHTPSVNTTYYATCENGICVSSRIATSQVSVTNNVNDPTNILVSNANICSGSSISLSATCTVGFITWYASETTIAALGTGTGFSQTPTTNSIYFVSCKDGVCESDRIPTVQVKVTPNVTNPTAVSVSQTAICNGTSISLSATCETGIITWYDQMTGGIALRNGNGFSQTPSTNTTYYVSCENGTPPDAICVSSRVSTNQVTVTNLPSDPTETSSPTICNNTSTSLSATCESGSVAWYNSSSSILLSTVSPFVTPNLSENTTYNVRCEGGMCQSNFVAVSVAIEAPINPSISGTDNLTCSFTSVSRTASGGVSYVWSSGLGNNALATISQSGTYTVTVTSVNGCTATATTAVTFTNNLVSSASNTGPYQLGQSILLSASGGENYSWSGPNNFSSTIANPMIINALAINGGIYSATVSTGICTATATTNVIVTGIDPCVQIMEYSYVLAGNPYQVLFPLTNGANIAQNPNPTSILVHPICNSVPIESVNMTISGPVNFSIIQNIEPFALFDNFGNNVYGQVLAPGTYSLTVTGYAQDVLGGAITYGPIVTTFTIVGNTPTISMPSFAGTEFCAGTSVNVSFNTTGTFAGGNLFNVLLSDENGNFNSPQIIGSTNVAGSVLCTIPNNAIGGENYRIKVVSTDPAASGNYNPVALTIHPRNLTLVSPTNDFSGDKTKKAIQTISATNKVNSPAKVLYQAGNAIMLNAGFEAKAGTVFSAEIGGCSY